MKNLKSSLALALVVATPMMNLNQLQSTPSFDRKEAWQSKGKRRKPKQR